VCVLQALDEATAAGQAVRTSPVISAAAASLFLSNLEIAYRYWVETLGLPPARPDAGLGPTPGLDLYLVPGSAALSVHVDPLRDAERASVHCRAGVAAPPLETAALCLAEAIVANVSAAETPAVRRSLAQLLFAQSFARSDRGALGEAQSTPERAPLRRDLGRDPGRDSGRDATRDSGRDAAAGSLFFQFLDERYGFGQPGHLPLALLSLAHPSTAPAAPEWHNQPDLVDALRAAVGGSPQALGDFLLDFALWRASSGSGHPASPVRFEWRIDAATLPRHLAPRRPLEPFGAHYFWLDWNPENVAAPAPLAFRANWERPVSLRWAIAALGPEGQLLRRLDPPFVAGASSSERLLEGLGDTRALLFVVTSLGDLGADFPFDPDHEPWEPHSFTLYLTRL
jgi:hypothetical protein